MFNNVITNKNGYVSHFTNSKNFLAAIIFLVISKIAFTACKQKTKKLVIYLKI